MIATALGVIAASLAGLGAWLAAGSPAWCDALDRVELLTRSGPVWIWLALLAFWLLAFLTVLPLGTASVMIAAFLLGPLAGVVQFVALLVASAVLFEATRARTLPAWLRPSVGEKGKITRLARRFAKRPFLLVVALRLLPVFPNAAACFGAAFFGAGRRPFYMGTVLVGWVRPVGFAVVGAMASTIPFCVPVA